MISFTAQILKEGGNYKVELPQEIRKNFTQKGYVPVRGTVDGIAYTGTLVPRKNDRYVLFIDYNTRRIIGKGEFDEVTVFLEFDPENRDLPIPEDMEMIFSEDPLIIETFLEMSTAHRREIIKLVNSAKRPETRLKYIERMREHVKGRIKKNRS